MTAFAMPRDLDIDIVPLGNSGEPVLVIDDVLPHPDALVEAAKASTDWHDLPPGGYPGRRAGLPRSYVQPLLRRLDGPIRQRLVPRGRVLDRFECSFSMVTQAPETLAPLQRVPHIDVANENRVAILHYLCDGRFGGTAFFRQSATGLEQVAAADRERYVAARGHDLAALKGSDGYPGEVTPGYERTNYIEAKFNRLIIYRSFTLHSGIIDRPDLLSDDPGKGRLTANFFVDYA